MNKNFKALTLAVVAASGLAACGGDDSDKLAPAKLTTTDEVAFILSANSSVGPALSGALVQYSVAQNPDAPACDSGTRNFQLNNSTIHTGDGTATFAQCATQKDTNKKTADGSVSLTCTDSEQTDTTCKALAYRFADGANGGTTFDLSDSNTATTEASPPYDFSYKVRGDIAESEVTEGKSELTYDVIMTATDNLRKFGITVDFSIHQKEGETGTGALGVKSTSKACPSGSVELSVAPPVGDNSPVITITGADGQTATVSTNSDQSVLITLKDGSTKTYTKDELKDPQAFCKPAAPV